VKFQLTTYQDEAVADVAASLQEGWARYASHQKLSAVSLAAPTGAGKTVIATAVIEQLLFGTEGTVPQPELTVLWVTDDPSLNQQTRKKMLQASSLIQPLHLVTVDQSLDQKTLDRGKVYFVHIQQLGKGSTNYVKIGDGRQYSLWDTIGSTIAERGGDFVLIVDEAHKGTGSKTGNKTITAQLIDGAGGSLPPTPVVLGISATPDRFVTAITKAGKRTLSPVDVDRGAVQDSGLIKDKIRIRHPRETQPGDATLLSLAVKDLMTYDNSWAAYATAQKEPHVSPALVVQVKAMTSDAELAQVLSTLSAEWNILDSKAIGHCFQEHGTLNLGTRSVRYVAPQDIQDDPHLRVILFKEALTTGWDCPRAEVMFSYRSAKDYTYIAQLIGRMVRTPLARRVSTDQFLNTVALYLPHFDDEQVSRVVDQIQSDDDGFTSVVEVDSVTCTRNRKAPTDLWTRIGSLPTYTRPGKHHRNSVARLNALATLLVGTSIDPKAIDTARKHITDTMAAEATRLGPVLSVTIADFEKLSYKTQIVDLATGDIEVEVAEIAINARNVDDLYRRARRTFGDAAAKWYWDALFNEPDADADAAKIKVAALAEDPSVSTALEASCDALVSTWRKQHNGAIGKLADAKRAHFYTIWQQAKKPEQVALILPTQITGAETVVTKNKDGNLTATPAPRHKMHIFTPPSKDFPAVVTGWEAHVLATELAQPTLVGWYRNPTGGTAAIAVPYEESGTARTMYPDFLFFHKVDGEIVVDLVDPHRPDSGDTGPKWTGLARYAEKHGSAYRRIVAVIEDGDANLLSLDLTNADVATALSEATNQTDIRAIFNTLGGTY
jgi:type III restriction enzyme